MDETSKSIQVLKTLKQVMGVLHQSIERQFKDVNLTGQQGMLIGMLMHCEKIKVTELSEKLNLSNSTVSSMLDRLEKQNIIERIRSSEDRRVVYITVTDTFRKLSKERFKDISQIIEVKMNAVPEDELDKILESLLKLKKILEQ